MGQTKAVLVVPAVAGDTCAKELFRIVPLCWRRLLAACWDAFVSILYGGSYSLLRTCTKGPVQCASVHSLGYVSSNIKLESKQE